MAYSKPQVTIDLEEYNELLKIKELLKKDKVDLIRTLDEYWATLQTIGSRNWNGVDPYSKALHTLQQFPYTPTQ